MSVSIIAMQREIAKQPISGVKAIFTSETAPVEAYNRALPILMPDPSRPVEGVISTRGTLGTLSTHVMWRRETTLNYVCLVSEVGAKRGPGSSATTLASVMEAVANALCEFAMDGVHVVGPITVRDVGIVQDSSSSGVNPQSARQFHGFTAQIVIHTSY